MGARRVTVRLNPIRAPDFSSARAAASRKKRPYSTFCCLFPSSPHAAPTTHRSKHQNKGTERKEREGKHHKHIKHTSNRPAAAARLRACLRACLPKVDQCLPPPRCPEKAHRSPIQFLAKKKCVLGVGVACRGITFEKHVFFCQSARQTQGATSCAQCVASDQQRTR